MPNQHRRTGLDPADSRAFSRLFRVFLTAGLGVAVATSSCFAQEAGKPEAGRALAKSLCSDCHQVTSEDQKPRAGVPGFPEVAKLPSTTALSIRVFLQSEHGRMPSFQLARDQIDDVVAFIISLKR